MLSMLGALYKCQNHWVERKKKKRKNKMKYVTKYL